MAMKTNHRCRSTESKYKGGAHDMKCTSHMSLGKNPQRLPAEGFSAKRGRTSYNVKPSSVGRAPQGSR
jgi:hypothetical protein